MRRLLKEVNLKVPVRQIIADEVKLTRKLTAPGKILVKANDKVNPEDVIAEGARSSGFRSIPLAAALGVSRSDGGKYLKVTTGAKVAPEQIIATKRKFFREVVIRSPVEGVLKEYNAETGNLRIEFVAKRERLTAACWGKILKVRNELEIEIETKITKVVGVEGAGRAREGQFKIVAKPADFLVPAAVTSDLSGKIIFGGARITKGALGKAISFGVAGIVVGGINVEDFFKAGGGKPGPSSLSSDVGITLVILEGFGLRLVSADVFQALAGFDGKFAIANGDAACLLVPSSKEGESAQGETPREKILSVADKVRITDPVNLGVTGVVLSISDKRQAGLLGLKNFLVEIGTASGKMVQPYSNLEVII